VVKAPEKQPRNSKARPLKIELLPIEKLASMASPYNPRTINEHDFKALCRSIEAFGVVEPVVCNKRSGNIVGGHQRVKAGLEVGEDTMPVWWVDLDEGEERLLNLALNRISGQWEDVMLAELLQNLTTAGADIELSGFNNTELELILKGWDGEGLEGLGGGAGHTQGIQPKIIVECFAEDKERVRTLVTEAVAEVDGCTVK
jgi:hypothetical protein